MIDSNDPDAVAAEIAALKAAGVTFSDGEHAREMIAKHSHLSPAKQRAEWRFWSGFYRCYPLVWAEDIRIVEELLSKE